MGNCFGSDEAETVPAKLSSSSTNLGKEGKRPPVTQQDIDDMDETDPLVGFLINPSNDTSPNILKFKDRGLFFGLRVDTWQGLPPEVHHRPKSMAVDLRKTIFFLCNITPHAKAPFCTVNLGHSAKILFYVHSILTVNPFFGNGGCSSEKVITCE